MSHQITPVDIDSLISHHQKLDFLMILRFKENKQLKKKFKKIKTSAARVVEKRKIHPLIDIQTRKINNLLLFLSIFVMQAFIWVFWLFHVPSLPKERRKKIDHLIFKFKGRCSLWMHSISERLSTDKFKWLFWV